MDVACDPASQQAEHLDGMLEPDDVAVGHDEHGRRRYRGHLRRGPVLRLRVQFQNLPDQLRPAAGIGSHRRVRPVVAAAGELLQRAVVGLGGCPWMSTSGGPVPNVS